MCITQIDCKAINHCDTTQVPKGYHQALFREYANQYIMYVPINKSTPDGIIEQHLKNQFISYSSSRGGRRRSGFQSVSTALVAISGTARPFRPGRLLLLKSIPQWG